MAHQPDYDTQWKILITLFFEEFVAFYLPKLYPEIDFNIPPEFLEQELHKLMTSFIKKDRRATDKLVKVHLKNGEIKYVLVHIEVQGKAEPGFGERMFIYYYRLFDKLTKDIVSIAIYTGNDANPPTKYEKKLFGTELSFTFNTYRVRGQNEHELLKSNNPFALVTLACLYALKSNKKEEQRLKFKFKLIRLMLEKQYPKYERAKIEALFVFIQHVLLLPPALEEKFTNTLKIQAGMEQTKLPHMFFTLSKKEQAWYEDMFKHLFGYTTDEKAEEKAEKMAGKMAEEMAGKMAEKMAKEMAEKMAGKIAMEMVNIKIDAVVTKNVVNMYAAKLSITQIADLLELKQEKVIAILATKKLLNPEN